MRILAAIPSKGRPENITKNILPFLETLKIDYAIFVEPQDEEKYNFNNVKVIPEDNMGLGYVLCEVKKYALENNYDLIFKIDDDVKGVGEIGKDLQKILKALEIPKVAAVCFPYEFEFYAKTKKLFTRINKRIQTCYIIKTSIFNPSVKVSTFEDFYQFLNIRNKGMDTLYCSRHLIKLSKMVGDGEGGLQDFNRKEMAKKEIQIFKGIDSGIKVIIKKGKPWYYEPKFTGPKFKSKAI